MRRLATLIVVLSLAVPAVTRAQAPAPAKPAGAASKGERERRAQAAFIAGRYEDAASLLHGLYIEFNNPVYLRNLGRSYQRLKDPERAISAFEEYLRSGRLKPAEQDEIRGYIKEMEELKKQKEAPPPPPPPPPVVTTPTPTPTPPPTVMPTAPEPTPTPYPYPGTTPPPTGVETQPQPAASGGGSGKLIGGILLGAAALMAGGGGALMAMAWSENDKAEKKGCPAYGCEKDADSIEQKALISKILFGAAAATGIAGGVVLVMSLSSDSSRAGSGMTIALQGKF